MLASSLISAGAALGGIAVGAAYTARSQKRDRKNTRTREQLQGFYSSMMGMRAEIATKSYIRNKVSSASGAEWAKLFENTSEPEHRAKIDATAWPKFERVPLYNDQQILTELVPLYKKMLDHFTNNLWLAEQSTQAFYPDFCEFVEIWNRFIAGAMPRAVIDHLEHSEAKLTPFYKDLNETFERLRASLSD